jgi:hypothetical protein
VREIDLLGESEPPAAPEPADESVRRDARDVAE